MELTLKRIKYHDDYTIGKLFVDGAFQCFTLEDVVRQGKVKVPGATAIPTGKYKVVIDMSQRFGRLMPHVLDVPGFDGIRIHTGNTAANTDGCILVGRKLGNGDVEESRMAFTDLYRKLEECHQPIFLTIS